VRGGNAQTKHRSPTARELLVDLDVPYERHRRHLENKATDKYASNNISLSATLLPQKVPVVPYDTQAFFGNFSHK